MIHLRKSILIVLMFSLFACSQSPAIPIEATASFTPYIGGTETALAVLTEISPTATPVSLPTLSFLPSITPRPVTTPTITPTAVTLPSDFSPLVYGKVISTGGGSLGTSFRLLGGVQGGSWLSVNQTVAQLKGASLYDVYTFAKGMFPVYGRIDRDSFLSPDAILDEIGIIGVAQDWQVTQRAVEELPATNEFYHQVVTDWLSQTGMTDPQIGTIQIHRVDLEGDGTDEIFVAATRVESQHTVKPGDHSIILMRKVIGNEAVTVPMVVDTYASLKPPHPFPCTYFIGNFIDLNQDGVLEVVVEFERWEGFGTAVYEVDGQNVQKVFGNTCITP